MTPAIASEPYIAEAPSFRMSMRSIASFGMVLTLIIVPRPKFTSTAATGAVRRPLIRISVPCEPKPRSEIVDRPPTKPDAAPSPIEPRSTAEFARSSSSTLAYPELRMSSRVILWTTDGVSCRCA